MTDSQEMRYLDKLAMGKPVTLPGLPGRYTDKSKRALAIRLKSPCRKGKSGRQPCGNAQNAEGNSKKEQGHYCGEKPKTIDEYILSQDADKQEELQHIRQILRSTLPEAEERIS